jgi:hypothetical protein
MSDNTTAGADPARRHNVDDPFSLGLAAWEKLFAERGTPVHTETRSYRRLALGEDGHIVDADEVIETTVAVRDLTWMAKVTASDFQAACDEVRAAANQRSAGSA